MDTIQSLLAFDGGKGESDTFTLVNTNDNEADNVLNVTRFVIEFASMGYDNSSWSPERSYWINLRNATSGTFTLEIYDPPSGEVRKETINYPVEQEGLETQEESLEAIIQRMIIPDENKTTCGLNGTSVCTNAVKVYSLGDDAFLVFFLGERLNYNMELNMTEKSLDDGFVPEYFQNNTNDILFQNSDAVYTAVEYLDIFMGDLDIVLNVRGMFT